MDDPADVCLSVAEKILSALEDKTIFQKYLKEKSRLLSDSNLNRTKVSANSISFPSFSASRSSPSPNSYVSSIISQIEKLQNELLPSTPVNHHENLDDALDSLGSVIETQITSHQFLKQKLMCENVKLKQAISNVKEVSLNDIQENRKKRIENDENWAQRKSRLLELEKAALHEKKKLKKQIDKLKVDNSKLQTEIEQIQSRTKQRDGLIRDAESEIEKLDEQISILQEQTEQLNYELELTNKANENLDNIQKFRIKKGGSLKLEKQKLLQELDELKRRNNMLVAELPKSYK